MSKKAFAVKAKDPDILKRSSSGGAFSLFAEEIIKDGGSVFGAKWEDCFTSVVLSEEVTDSEVSALCGSKYLRADISDSFDTAQKRLEDGKKVLFSATPCQIAALKKKIPENLQENFYTVDFICHGTPKNEIWREYLFAREKDAESMAQSVSFRNKDEGWRKYAINIEFENGKIYRRRAAEDPYLRGYVSNLFLNDGCYNCPFKGNYKSDITIGDFWGAEKHCGMDPEMGISVVVCNTEKGLSLLEKVDAEKPSVDFDSAFLSNPSYHTPSVKSVLGSDFLKTAKKRGADAALEKYAFPKLPVRIKRKILMTFRRKNEHK